jgi:hypothetical protein
METICQPAAVRCWMISGLMGPEMTSRMRSKCAIGASVICAYQGKRKQFNCQNYASIVADKELIRRDLRLTLWIARWTSLFVFANSCSVLD